MTHFITCRARVAPGCLHGQPTAEQFLGEDLPQSEDGTYDPRTGSLVCDLCYLKLLPLTPSGKGLLHELPAAISKARGE